MTPPPPDLLLFNGRWTDYVEELYCVFLRDIAGEDLYFRGKIVDYRKLPISEERYASFWHITSSGPVEEERKPDLRRCERLPWLRWIIEHADQCSDIDIWQNIRGTSIGTLLWYLEEYIVILEERKKSWLLKTAFYTEEEDYRIRRIRRERDRYRPERIEKRKRDLGRSF